VSLSPDGRSILSFDAAGAIEVRTADGDLDFRFAGTEAYFTPEGTAVLIADTNAKQYSMWPLSAPAPLAMVEERRQAR
jgi:hypothetical protein